MVKTKNKTGMDDTGQPKACLLCQKKYKNVVELCTYCKKKLASANDPNTTSIDSDLITAFNQKRAVDKTNCVKKLVT